MNRKRISLMLVALAAITCGTLDTFAVSESSRATIPRGNVLEQLAGDVGFGDFVKLDITESQQLQNQGVTRNQIDSVRVDALTLEVVSPEGGDLSFLDELGFFVEAPGEARRRIARGGPFPAGEASVSLTLDDVDLAPYAAAESMTITTEVSGSRPDQDTTVDATIELIVDVNVGGVVCGG